MPRTAWVFRIALDKDGTGERSFRRENMPADLGSDWSPLLGKGSDKLVTITMPEDHAREVHGLAKAAAVVKLVNPARIAYRKHGWEAAKVSLGRVFGERMVMVPVIRLTGDYLAAQVEVIRASNPRHEVVVEGRVFETIEEMLEAAQQDEADVAAEQDEDEQDA